MYVSRNGSQNVSTVDLTTYGGRVNSTISLASTAAEGVGGNFFVSAYSIEGPLALNVTAAPPDSVLTLRASAQGAAVDVSLPAAFEGNFAADTVKSLAGACISVGNSEDPAGRNRHRSINYVRAPGGNSLYGTAVWDQRQEQRGLVQLQSSFGGANIRFP